MCLILGMFPLVGRQMEVYFIFCACSSVAETLVKNKFFPATPKHPRLAFSFTLFDILEACMLECQVALKDFVAALDFLSSAPMFKVHIEYKPAHTLH